MPGVDYYAVRSVVSIDDVLNLLSWSPSGGWGEQLRGPCPVHGSSSPDSRTFSVNTAIGRYYCHKCKSGGNVIELWAAVNGMSIYAAAINLCNSLGIDVPWIRRW